MMACQVLSPHLTPASPLLDGGRTANIVKRKTAVGKLGSPSPRISTRVLSPLVAQKLGHAVDYVARPTIPPSFPTAELGKARRISCAPLVLMSYNSGRFFCSDPSDRGKSSQFGGVVVRCCEVRAMPAETAAAANFTVMAPAPEGRVFAHDGKGPLFALKVIRRDAMRAKAIEQGRPLGRMIGEDPVKEISALQRVNANGGHAHVEQLVEALCDEDFVYKVTKYYALGEAFDHVPLAERPARRLMRQVLKAVGYLHSKNICHRDISLENILVERGADGGPSARLVDLGMAVVIPTDALGRKLPLTPQGRCGKPATMAPEVYHNKEFDGVAADVFSCGAVLYMLITGVQPWAHVGDALFDAIAVQGRLAALLASWGLQQKVSAEAVDLLQKMLRNNPRDRIATVEGVLAHPFFAKHADGLLV